MAGYPCDACVRGAGLRILTLRQSYPKQQITENLLSP